MKVKELMEILSIHPQDTEVGVVWCGEGVGTLDFFIVPETRNGKKVVWLQEVPE